MKLVLSIKINLEVLDISELFGSFAGLVLCCDRVVWVVVDFSIFGWVILGIFGLGDVLDIFILGGVLVIFVLGCVLGIFVILLVVLIVGVLSSVEDSVDIVYAVEILEAGIVDVVVVIVVVDEVNVVEIVLFDVSFPFNTNAAFAVRIILLFGTVSLKK